MLYNKKMTPLAPIMKLIQDDFETEFLDSDFIYNWENVDSARDYFDSEFENRYNTDEVYVDLNEIKKHITSPIMMLISEYVATKYEEYGKHFNPSVFNENKMITEFIYFYVYTEFGKWYIDKIDEHFASKEEEEAEAH